MAKVYLSSPFWDLARHRAAVYRALRRLGHDVVAMEDYVATDERPKDKCLADVTACDLYVGVLAWRYGFVPPGENCSITELEMRQAAAQGKPRLMFLLDERARWPAARFDADLTPIRKLRDAVKLEVTVSHFHTAAELAELVAGAVTNQLRESASAEVLLDVGVASDVEDNRDEPAPLVAHYACHGDGVPLIAPRFPFLESVAHGEPVVGLGEMKAAVFPARYPRLEVRIVNSGGTTLLVNAIALAVEWSLPLDWPLCIPANYARPRRQLIVLNEGSGRIGPMTLRYGVFAWGQARKPTDPLRYSVQTSGFESSWFADLTEGVAGEGVDVDALEALQSEQMITGGPNRGMPGVYHRTVGCGLLEGGVRDRLIAEACGNFVGAWARVVALLEPADRSVPPLHFETKISLADSTGYRPDRKPLVAPDLMLESGGANYTASRSLDLALKAGESAPVRVLVGAPRPSAHRARVELTYNHTRRAVSPPFDLQIFVPRSSYQTDWWTWMYARPHE